MTTPRSDRPLCVVLAAPDKLTPLIDACVQAGFDPQALTTVGGNEGLAANLKLLEKCRVVVACVDRADQCGMVALGYAAARGKTLVVLKRRQPPPGLMVEEMAYLVVTEAELANVLTALFPRREYAADA